MILTFWLLTLVDLPPQMRGGSELGWAGRRTHDLGGSSDGGGEEDLSPIGARDSGLRSVGHMGVDETRRQLLSSLQGCHLTPALVAWSSRTREQPL